MCWYPRKSGAEDVTDDCVGRDVSKLGADALTSKALKAQMRVGGFLRTRTRRLCAEIIGTNQNLLRTLACTLPLTYSLVALKRPRNLGRTHFLRRSNHLMSLMQIALFPRP